MKLKVTDIEKESDVCR